MSNAFCYYCGVTLTKNGHRRLTWDHRVPKAKGGSNQSDNLVAACWLCNQEKGTMVENDFIELLYSRTQQQIRHIKAKRWELLQRQRDFQLLMQYEKQRRQRKLESKELSMSDLEFLYQIGVEY